MIKKVIDVYLKQGFKGLIEGVSRRINMILFSPNIFVDSGSSTIRLGTEYGGWTFVDRPDLTNSTIISCGLGEDASFDVEFATKYNAMVVIVDPTPRAIDHFKQLTKRFGLKSACYYSSDGKQPVEAYDLSSLSKKNFIHFENAIWIEANKKIKFYKPKVKESVSHSLVNYQHNYSKETAFIEVDGITLDKVMEEIGIKEIVLLKLDIEGAEVPVIADMLDKGIKPKQLLVEFDELNVPSKVAKKNFEDTDKRLRRAGYKLIHYDGKANFLYTQSRSLS